MYASKLIMLASAVRFFFPVHTSTPCHNRQAWVPIEVIRTTPAYICVLHLRVENIAARTLVALGEAPARLEHRRARRGRLPVIHTTGSGPTHSGYAIYFLYIHTTVSGSTDIG